MLWPHSESSKITKTVNGRKCRRPRESLVGARTGGGGPGGLQQSGRRHASTANLGGRGGRVG